MATLESATPRISKEGTNHEQPRSAVSWMLTVLIFWIQTFFKHGSTSTSIIQNTQAIPTSSTDAIATSSKMPLYAANEPRVGSAHEEEELRNYLDSFQFFSSDQLTRRLLGQYRQAYNTLKSLESDEIH